MTRCDIPEPIAPPISGLAARLRGEQLAALEMLRSAVAAAVEDYTHLQAVAGPHVHVVYYDTTIAAAEVLDDRAWGDLADQWALLAAPHRGALRAAARAQPAQLARRPSGTCRVGRVAPRGARGGRHAHRVTGAPRITRSRAVLLDAWQGNDEAARTGARRMMQDGTSAARASASTTPTPRFSSSSSAPVATTPRRERHDTLSTMTPSYSARSCCPTSSRPRTAATTRSSHSGHSTGCRNERPQPTHRGLAARSHAGRALIATGDDADEQFRVALDALSNASVQTDMARTQLLYGEWLRRQRRRKEARDPLHEALELFETIGASAFAARTCAELAATGEHVRSRSAPADILTPQEAQIARLAVSGARNREIAAQLYITTSTVEYHLRKVFVKLGVTSRTQLAQVDLPT